MHHYTPTKKCGHHDSHVAKDGDSDDDDDEKRQEPKNDTVELHLIGKDNTFAGA